MGVQLLISAPLSTHLSIQPSGLSFKPKLETQASVVLPNASLVPLFLLVLVRRVGTQIQAQMP